MDEIFKDFLPEGYGVVQQGHVITEDNIGSRQIDIIILKPGYPKVMVNDGYYPSESVLAGFECKLSLTLADVKDTIEKAKQIKKLFQFNVGSIDKELSTPFVYGLVALGHSVAEGEKSLKDRVYDVIVKNSKDFENPSELLDLLVIPESLFLGLRNHVDYYDETVEFAYEDVECDFPYTGPLESPLGKFYSCFLHKLPYKEASLEHQRDLYFFLGARSTMRFYPELCRSWDKVFSDQAIELVRSEMAKSADWLNIMDHPDDC